MNGVHLNKAKRGYSPRSSTRPRVLVDAVSLLTPMAGIARYTSELVHRLDDFDVVLWDGQLHRPGSPAPNPVTRKLWSTPGVRSLARLAQTTRYQPGNRGFDLHWSPNNIFREGLKGHREVLTVHDHSWLLFPDAHPWSRRRKMARQMERDLRRASAVITGCARVEEEIRRLWGMDHLPIHVIPHGVDHTLWNPAPEREQHRIRGSYHLEKPYVLALGTVEPRKNLKLLLDAWPSGGPIEAELVIVGGGGWQSDDIHRRFSQDSVRYLGHVPDADLPALVSTAAVFCYPSRYEGFGLPPLEAMACGTPVVISRREPMLTTVGDAGLSTDPDDPAELRSALTRLLSDHGLRTSMAEAGIKRAAGFSWERSATAHAQVFRSILQC